MDVAAKVTSKGQITIPKEVREALGIVAGDRVVFKVEEQRAIIARTPNLLELAGIVDVPLSKKGVAWDQVRKTTRQNRFTATP